MTELTTAKLREMLECAKKGGHFTIEQYLIGKIGMVIVQASEQVAIIEECLRARGEKP